MLYRYETHCHTHFASACAKSTGSEHVYYYKEMGYQGIIITDHFFGGNCAVPANLPWATRVDMFCAGYEDARIAGEKCGLDVFFGWEQNYEQDEYLIYGPDKAWLLAHPDIEHWSRRKQLEEVHKAGGAVIQAHPFRARAYIKYTLLGKDYCDGIEGINASNLPINDFYAQRYAKACDLLMTGGSDNHHSANFEPVRLSGVDLEERLTSVLDYARLIRTRGRIHPVIPDGWLPKAPTEPAQPTYWVCEGNPDFRRIPTGRTWEEET